MLYRKITSYIEDYLKSDNNKILILDGVVFMEADTPQTDEAGNRIMM